MCRRSFIFCVFQILPATLPLSGTQALSFANLHLATASFRNPFCRTLHPAALRLANHHIFYFCSAPISKYKAPPVSCSTVRDPPNGFVSSRSRDFAHQELLACHWCRNPAFLHEFYDCESQGAFHLLCSSDTPGLSERACPGARNCAMAEIPPTLQHRDAMALSSRGSILRSGQTLGN